MGRSGRFYYCGVLIALVLLIVALQCQIYAQQPGGVSVGYYQSNGLCNADVEGIVSSTVSQAMQADPTIPAGLLRLLFHDCWVEVTSTEAFRAILRSVFCWAEFYELFFSFVPLSASIILQPLLTRNQCRRRIVDAAFRWSSTSVYHHAPVTNDAGQCRDAMAQYYSTPPQLTPLRRRRQHPI
jgi:hypothetical protein